MRKLDTDVFFAFQKCQDLGISLEKVISGKPQTFQVPSQLPLWEWRWKISRPQGAGKLMQDTLFGQKASFLFRLPGDWLTGFALSKCKCVCPLGAFPLQPSPPQLIFQSSTPIPRFSTAINLPLARYHLPFISRSPEREALRNGLSLTITTRVEKMLSQVTAKHPLLLHLPLFPLLWAGLHHGTKEGEELAALLWHCTTKGRNQFISGLAPVDEAEHSTFYRAPQNGKNMMSKCVPKWIFPNPGEVQGQTGWGPGQPGPVPH